MPRTMALGSVLGWQPDGCQAHPGQTKEETRPWWLDPCTLHSQQRFPRCTEFEARVRAWAEVVTTKQTNKKARSLQWGRTRANACDREPMAGKASTGFRVFCWFLFLSALFVFWGRISGSLCCAMIDNVAEDGSDSGPFCLHFASVWVIGIPHHVQFLAVQSLLKLGSFLMLKDDCVCICIRVSVFVWLGNPMCILCEYKVNFCLIKKEQGSLKTLCVCGCDMIWCNNLSLWTKQFTYILQLAQAQLPLLAEINVTMMPITRTLCKNYYQLKNKLRYV